jgi:hypothetical protein
LSIVAVAAAVVMQPTAKSNVGVIVNVTYRRNLYYYKMVQDLL